MDMTTRRSFLGGLSAFAATPAIAAPAPPLPPGRTGWILMDVESGEVLDSRMPGQAFIPASTVKSVTSFLTLSAYKPSARFSTRIMADGPIVDGTLAGDLHLVGGGDPGLDTADLWGIAESLREAGLRKVTGRFLYTADALPRTTILNPMQPMQAGYNPSLSGLNLNFNRVLMKWRERGTIVSGTAFASQKSAPAQSVFFRSSIEATEMAYEASGPREIWTVPLRALRKDGQRWFPVRRPGAYTAQVLRTLCREAEITLPAAAEAMAPPMGEALVTHRSEVALALLTKMMKYSNNLTAEALGAASIGQLAARPASVEEAARMSGDWLRGQGRVLDPVLDADFTLANHSGLSTASRMTPLQLATVLRAGYQRFGSSFMAMHSKGKVRLDKGEALPPYTLHTKTGTLNYVRALTGYIEINRRRAAFVIFNVEDDTRARLDAAFTPFDESRPPGARRWLRKALNHENALLKRWVKTGFG